MFFVCIVIVLMMFAFGTRTWDYCAYLFVQCFCSFRCAEYVHVCLVILIGFWQQESHSVTLVGSQTSKTKTTHAYRSCNLRGGASRLGGASTRQVFDNSANFCNHRHANLLIGGAFTRTRLKHLTACALLLTYAHRARQFNFRYLVKALLHGRYCLRSTN